MEIPTHYLIFAAEVFFTTLGLLFALIYFYIRTDRQWQLHVHNIQDQLLNFRNKYLEEKERADIIRELLHEKNCTLEKTTAALAKAQAHEKNYLVEIARLKEEIESLLQSEKLRSEIVNQLVTSKIEIEQLITKLNEHQKHSDELQATISILENEVSTFNSALQPVAPSPATEESKQNHDLPTSDALELDRLRIRTNKQNETIRELELELMKLGYKNPSTLTTGNATDNQSNSQNLERTLSESETCIQLLEGELSGLQEKINSLEEQAQNNQTTPQNNGDMQQLERMLNESEACVQLLESELSGLQDKINNLEEKTQNNQTAPQNNNDMQRLEQMLKESETCNTLLEAELDSLMKKVRLLEEKPPKEAVYCDT